APRFQQFGRLFSPSELVRMVRPLAGSPKICVRVRPARDYGKNRPQKTWGSNHVRYLGGDFVIRLTTNCSLTAVIEETPFVLRRSFSMLIGPDETPQGSVPDVARQFYEQTVDYWLDWVRDLSIPFEWQEEIIRAAITIKLAAYDDTGAIVAALTTSIPESANSGRNWDYRYCWIRDAYYTVQALNRLGALDVLENYLTYLRNIVDLAKGGHIQPLYAVSGEPALEESTADSLSGYRGMGPVRVGNAAFSQVQHDAYGQIVLSNTQAFFDERLLRKATQEDFAALEKVGERAWKHHDQPDAGLWEYRSRTGVHTYSAVMSWAACDRLTNIGVELGLAKRAALWRRRAEKIRAVIERSAWLAREKRFAASFGGREVDASLLQLLEMRFLEPDDPRFAATLKAVERELRRGDQLLRYAAEDDFGLPETAFNFCTFWFIEALHLVGRRQEARELFMRMLDRLTPAGLLSEDSDFASGELWGNYPQTYSLVGLINCAGLLSKPWSSVR
ncbi:MAG: glycoside hydrolase family 15 protein, partial [Betaproteobacteria bacterium]